MRPQFYKVTDHPNLIKDSSSKAVLNTDPGAIARHEKLLAKIQQEQKIKEDISNLQRDVGEIKSLLLQLLGKNNG